MRFGGFADNEAGKYPARWNSVAQKLGPLLFRWPTGCLEENVTFLHDIPPKIIERGETRQRPEADIVFSEPCRFEAWPEVPINVIAGRDDRFFPIDFQRRVAGERLHVSVDELAGGHLLALANPRDLVDQLLDYLRADTQT